MVLIVTPKWMGNSQSLTLTKNYRQLRNVESGRNSLLQGRAHQLDSPYQLIIPESTYTSNIIQTEEVAVMHLRTHTHVYVYIFIYVYSNKEKEIKIRRSGGINGRIQREEREGGWCKDVIISKKIKLL